MIFNEYWKNETHWDDPGAIANKAWNAAMEEFQRNPPEGLYRIGEKVLAHGKPGVVLVYDCNKTITDQPDSVRRKPAWVPKDGEALLFNNLGKACLGVWHEGHIYDSNGPWYTEHGIRPVDYDKVGKPWDEV